MGVSRAVRIVLNTYYMPDPKDKMVKKASMDFCPVWKLFMGHPTQDQRRGSVRHPQNVRHAAGSFISFNPTALSTGYPYFTE